MAEPYIQVLDLDDWLVVFYDGVKVYEGHPSDVKHHLLHKVFHVEWIPATDEQMEAAELGITPDRLER